MSSAGELAEEVQDLKAAELRVWGERLQEVPTQEEGTVLFRLTAEEFAEALLNRAKGRKAWGVSEFCTLMMSVAAAGEKRYSSLPGPVKARSLKDTGLTSAIIQLKGCADTPAQEAFALAVENELLSSNSGAAGARRGSPVHKRSADFLAACQGFASIWKEVSKSFNAHMDGPSAKAFWEVMERLIGHVSEHGAELDYQHILAVKNLVRVTVRKGTSEASDAVPERDRKKLLEALKILERQFMIESLPQLQEKFEQLEREYPKQGFHYCRHVASCLRGAVESSSWLSSYPKFGEQLRNFRDGQFLSTLRVERDLVVYLCDALALLGAPLANQKPSR